MDESILEAVLESVKDMHDIGLMDNQTMREFDLLCLPEVKVYTSKQIKKIRVDKKR